MMDGEIARLLGPMGMIVSCAQTAGRYWIFLVLLLGQVLLGWRMRRRMAKQRLESRNERRMREELQAYAELDPSTAQAMGAGMETVEAARELAKRVCRTIAERSVFSRVTMLLRDAEGNFRCVGSVGMDDLTVAALQSWGEQVTAEERCGVERGVASMRKRATSFSISLGEWGEFDREVGSWAMRGRKERRRWRRAIVAPVRTRTGRWIGAIAVCEDGTGREIDEEGAGLKQRIGAIEALTVKLARTMENDALSERLLRAEKLAGLGQLAGGVAHALNNPLTAVLGFAELIAETAAEPRVRMDAGTIQAEARKMKDTVQKLTEFWRPVTLRHEPVAVREILGELGAACAGTLQQRGVRLEITGGEGSPLVRGSRERLREVMEHLLNNAAQAIASARPREAGEEHAIRVTMSHDEHALHVVVSDTGPGFREPGRVFDPFYTTKQPDEGTGLGLSICYGIVREHGGEISAFNLHPHGAAVVLELPLRRTVREESVLQEAMSA